MQLAKKVRAFFGLVSAANERIGEGASFLVLFLMAFTATEAVARYVFDSPTIWVWPISKQIFGTFILFGAAYTLIHGGHIRLEILYSRFSSKTRRVVKLVTLICVLIFIGVLVWQGGSMAGNAIEVGERSNEIMRIPLYPFKTLFPIAASLFLLQGIAEFFRKETPKKP